MISQLSSPGSQMPPRVWGDMTHDHIPDISLPPTGVWGDHTHGASVTLIGTSSPDQTHSESPLGRGLSGGLWWDNICEIWNRSRKKNLVVFAHRNVERLDGPHSSIFFIYEIATLHHYDCHFHRASNGLHMHMYIIALHLLPEVYTDLLSIHCIGIVAIFLNNEERNISASLVYFV